MATNSAGQQVKHLSVALGVIDTIAVSLRLLARWKSRASFGGDDVLVVLSLVPLYCMVAIGFLGAPSYVKADN